MNVTQLYKCLCDVERIRILNLLREGPLCVCHVVEILEAEQVKISKQLSYMKKLGVIESERHAQWMVYRLAEPKSPVLVKNLKCLKKNMAEELHLKDDLRKRETLIGQLRCEPSNNAVALIQQQCCN